MSATIRSEQDENVTHDAKVSDSGYSNSCRNSQSQRSTGSSQSRHSSSSGSSGYGGHQTANSADTATGSKRKEKDVKKKSKCVVEEEVSAVPKEATTTPVLGDTSQQQSCSANESKSPNTPVSTETEALQIATLTKTLSFIKKLKHKDSDLDNHQSRVKIDDHTQERIMQCLQQQESCKEEMQIVVSMEDGAVLYTSNLTEVLGFPRDMWVGRSLIDFVHPKHRMSFASHITSAIADSDVRGQGLKIKGSSFFCCLRSYRGLKTVGFSIADKRVTYAPCQMCISIRQLDPSKQEGLLLVITARPIRSAYKYPEESKVSPKFTIRHCASTLICDVDPEIVQYLGFLPQDIVGHSFLSLCHPDDLPLIKHAYQSVMKEQRQPLRSRPYRMLCQNGSYVLVETEWSAFINPWSRKLEFMIGQHTILKGPLYPDVTTPVDLDPPAVSEESMKEIQKIQDDIKCVLSATVGCSTESAKQQVSKRCKDLAMFMETLMDEITKPQDLKVEVPVDDDKSFSERDSVMLGEISPHHDFYDSKSSSETPPSYNQLNYKENLQRFFESNPKTTLSDESGESKTGPSVPKPAEVPRKDKDTQSNNKESAKTWSNNQLTSTEGSGGESSSSGGGKVEEKVAPPPPIPAQAGPSRPPTYNPPLLTEKLLNKHNEDMEKRMVQRHREQRSKTGDSKGKEKHKTNFDKYQEEVCHGLKRSGSHSFEGEPFKVIKASHHTPTEPATTPALPPTTWPAFGPPPPRNSNGPAGNAPVSGVPLVSPLLPMYYVHPTTEDRTTEGPTQLPTFITPPGTGNYMPGMLYQPIAIVGPPAPVLYSPMTVLPAPVFPPQPPMKPRPQLTQTLSEQCKSNSPQKMAESDSNGTSNIYDDSSFYSSFGSFPFKKTDNSDESMKSSMENDGKSEDMSWEKSDGRNNHGSPKARLVRMVAPWMEEITVTPELTLKYQLKERGLDDILRSDIQALEKITQPSLVNDQLSQMYQDLELEGLSRSLTLDEGITSSSSESSPEDKAGSSFKRKKKRYMDYDKMAILYEENAPLPPPLVDAIPT